MINESLLQPDTPSALDICNAALSKIGEAPLDALIANESTASRLCVLHYHPARRETLCMARWTFAATPTTLDSVSAQAPNSLTPYQFTLPADCLRVLDVECSEWKMQGLCIHASNALYGKTLPLQLIHPTFYLSFADDDTRRDVTVGNYSIDAAGNDIAVPYGALNLGKWRCNWKAGPRTATLKTDVNWPILRYSDVLLMYAEAENYLNNGPTEAAKAAYEQVRLRAFAGDASRIGTTPSTYDTFFKAIVKERAFELATEGWRRTDLIRWNLLAETLAETKANTEKLAMREVPYNEVKTYRAYKEATSTSWKDPLVGLTYIDFDHQPTETEMSELVARYGGTWNWVNMFITTNIAGETNSGIAGQSKILGYKENNNTLPAWITELYRGFIKNQAELYTLSTTAIIDVNPGLTGQQHPAY